MSLGQYNYLKKREINMSVGIHTDPRIKNEIITKAPMNLST